MGPYDARLIGAVTLFEDGNCEGGSGRFYWDPEQGEDGTFYGNEDLIYGLFDSVRKLSGENYELFKKQV